MAALAAKYSKAAPLFAIFGRASGQILVKMRVLARQGHYSSCEKLDIRKPPAVRPARRAVIKSAASAAFPEGFPSRDPVSR